MQNSSIAAVATAISAVALGMFLAVPGNAAAPAGTNTVSGSVAGDAVSALTPAINALSCGSDAVRTDVSKHFSVAGLNGVSTVAPSAREALAGYLAERGAVADASPAAFKETAVTADRVIFTSLGATKAVIVDRTSPTLWDWNIGASCA